MAAVSQPILTDTLSRSNIMPSHYVRPIGDRPTFHIDLDQVDQSGADVSNIPFIDFDGFDGPNRSKIVAEIGEACRNDGFFRVKNHGIPRSVMEDLLAVSRGFFGLPEAERMKSYSDDPTKTVRLSTSFNVKKEKVSNWRDYLRLYCYPLQDYIEDWPSNPPSFKAVVSEYCKCARALALKLLEAISESLGLEKECIEKILGKQGQHMALNYYPPCPHPELTYGLPGHTDPNALTLLLQDQVPGLQVLRNNTWVAVHPLPNTFIVNIGDQIQVISNGRYKSVLHRAVVNNRVERISVPTFYCPSLDAMIGPAEALLDDDDNPPAYRSFTYREYYDKFWDIGLQTQCCVDLFKT